MKAIDMYIIGITGGTGAGKTTALKALEKLGVPVFDCDVIYHGLLLDDSDMQNEIAARFPDAGGVHGVDRKKLAFIVYNDLSSLLDLNMITHKYVSRELDRRINDLKKSGGAVIAIDAIALVESGISERCDVRIGVTAPAEDRVRRIMARDGITRGQAELRINAQKPDGYYIENCDHILKNVYKTPEEFMIKCTKFFMGLLNKN